MTTPKAATKIYFMSGDTLQVVEAVAVITGGTIPPAWRTVHDTSGTSFCINLRTVERMEALA